MSAHLVVVDLQAVFGAPDSPWRAPRFDAVLDPVGRLVDAFGPEVTFTRFVAPDVPAGAWRAYYERWPFALVGADDPLYALTDRFASYDRDALTATTFGKWAPALAARVGDATELVVCGVSTDCCVLSTVLAAADSGRRVRVAADACAGASDDAHGAALAVMAGYAPLVEVTDTAAVLAGRAQR